MGYFDKHVFFCTNQRDNNENCCANCNASEVHAHAKARIKQLGLNGAGKIRMNKAGCLDRCDEGPVLVVYPEGVWYTYVDQSDIDEIIDSHLVGGQVVETAALAMNPKTRHEIWQGAAGPIEVSIDEPNGDLKGLAVIAHPHPLFGGTKDNKVVQTLARAFLQLGYTTLRFNFRGVGQSAGTHDHGQGETDDLVNLLNTARSTLLPPHLQHEAVALAGFSFGALWTSHAAQRLREQGVPIGKLALVGTATSRFQVADVPADTLVIHGETDDTVPLSSVLTWANAQQVPVLVMPGVEHFFHGKLPQLKDLVVRYYPV